MTGPNDARLDALYPLEDYDNIVIIPDNDKSGLESARLIANWLINRGSKVKIVQIDGVKDISDWIKTGKYTSFDLEELIDRAKYAQFSGDPMAYLRKTYALLNVGGSPVALNLKAFSKGQIVTSSYDNFMHGDGGRTTTIKKKIKDKIVEIVTKVGPTWWEQELNSGMRTPVFKPGQKEVKADEFNFWNGWGVEPSEEGSCELFKDHLLNVVCSGNQDWYKFLWDWFCDMFQNPQEHNGVILAIQGNEGSGKSFIGEQVISRLLGDGGYHLLGDDKPLESQFTEFLANTLLLQLDESFFSGSHAVKNFLKHISVSKKLEINKKFLSGFTVDNYLHILVTSNADWFVPPGYLDRRYFVLKTTDAHLRDFPYFKAIMDQLEAGGFQRLLWELLTTKITSDWSKIPMTDVKQEQIEYGEPIKLWWKDCVLHHPLIDTTDETIEELEKLVLDSPMFPYEGQELTPTEFYQMFRCWYDATKQRGEFPRSVDAFGKKVRALVGLKSEEPKWITRDEKPTKSRVYVIRY